MVGDGEVIGLLGNSKNCRGQFGDLVAEVLLRVRLGVLWGD